MMLDRQQLALALAPLLWLAACQSASSGGVVVDAATGHDGSMSATPPPAAPPSARPSTPALEALAAEYRALRAVPRSAAVDERKRELLDELGKRLGDGKHSRADVLRLMGPPDTGEKGSGVIFGLLRGEPRPPQGNELLIYYWRGGHDFLYFDCDGPTVFGASWWAAGD